MCSKQEIDALCGSNRKTVVEEYVFSENKYSVQ